MAQYVDKSALIAEIKNRRDSFYSLSKSCEKGTPAKVGFYAQAQTLEGILTFIDTLEVKKIPSWKKTMHDNGCWSCEIGVNPSKRLYEYEHYTINADELFKLLDKEE